jgi:hypothetical protein
LGCKGITTFNAGGKRMALLTKKDGKTNHPPAEERHLEAIDASGEACTFDPATGRKSCE